MVEDLIVVFAFRETVLFICNKDKSVVFYAMNKVYGHIMIMSYVIPAYLDNC